MEFTSEMINLTYLLDLWLILIYIAQIYYM